MKFLIYGNILSGFGLLTRSLITLFSGGDVGTAALPFGFLIVHIVSFVFVKLEKAETFVNILLIGRVFFWHILPLYALCNDILSEAFGLFLLKAMIEITFLFQIVMGIVARRLYQVVLMVILSGLCIFFRTNFFPQELDVSGDGVIIVIIWMAWAITAILAFILWKAIADAEYGKKVKEEFLSRISHDLRTPLNAIHGFTELLSSTPLNEEQVSYVNIVTSAAGQLVDITNDINSLTSVRNDRQGYARGTAHAGEILGGALSAVRTAADKRRVRLEAGDYLRNLRQVRGDLNTCSHALEHLIRFVIKSSEPGTSLRFDITVEDRNIRFAVTGRFRVPLQYLSKAKWKVPDDQIPDPAGAGAIHILVSLKFAEIFGGAVGA